VLRNEYERRGNKPPETPLDLEYLHRVVGQYTPLTPIEKMDFALLVIERLTERIGQRIRIYKEDISSYQCKDFQELISILKFLIEQGHIQAQDPVNPHSKLWLTARGYQRVTELRKASKQSNICFVAMWFNPDEMDKAYMEAIKPAIEYFEEGVTESRFKAVKIDNVEHINDINDEIIATIRRSQFIVCDLTGYRGGVYFEAGFAYGLGLPVIYTCRKDWTKEQILRAKNRRKMKELYDENMKPVRVRKEGVHFDLAHRNRIEWEIDKLDDLKVKLENRIKAVIV
jgi:nucleoside 2-deoxyribosyltransferase